MKAKKLLFIPIISHSTKIMAGTKKLFYGEVNLEVKLSTLRFSQYLYYVLFSYHIYKFRGHLTVKKSIFLKVELFINFFLHESCHQFLSSN